VPRFLLAHPVYGGADAPK